MEDLFSGTEERPEPVLDAHVDFPHHLVDWVPERDGKRYRSSYVLRPARRHLRGGDYLSSCLQTAEAGRPSI
jgi:hypothetical protein